MASALSFPDDLLLCHVGQQKLVAVHADIIVWHRTVLRDGGLLPATRSELQKCLCPWGIYGGLSRRRLYKFHAYAAGGHFLRHAFLEGGKGTIRVVPNGDDVSGCSSMAFTFYGLHVPDTAVPSHRRSQKGGWASGLRPSAAISVPLVVVFDRADQFQRGRASKNGQWGRRLCLPPP